MKNIKEKQLLVNFAKAFGQDVDESISNEVTAINEIKLNAIKSIKKNSFEVLSEAFKKAKEEEKKTNLIEYPLPPSLDDVMSLIEETEQDIQKVEERDIQKEAVDFISKSIKEDSYQQPEAPVTSPDITAIQKKLQFLEQWVSKISMAGQGSGEVKFKYLDDIEKNTIGNTDQILRYRPSNIAGRYGTFFFGQLSGNQGPIESMLYNPTQDIYDNAPRQAGLTYYDSREDTLEIIHADGAATYTGQDNYIRVYNNYGANLTKGTFVQFSGAVEDVVTCAPFVNNANALPLYSIGVLATDTEANTIGRAKLLGEIRDIDTTGASVGETWQLGDILWSNPNQPGTLTKVKPTAPNIAVSVAAVLNANSTSGIMLVRPTLWPRLRYGDFYSVFPQIAPAPNQDVKVTISNVLIASGFTIAGNSIVALDSGLYKFQTRVQITSSSSSSKSIIVWYKKNGVNIPYSAVRQSVSENGGYRTITNFQLVSMDASDNVSVHFTVTDTSLSIDSPAVFDGAPGIPSIQIAVTEAAL
jgi:hypothetical protein